MKKHAFFSIAFFAAINSSFAMDYGDYLRSKYDVEQLKASAAARRGAYLGARAGSTLGVATGAVGGYLALDYPEAIPAGGAIGGVAGGLIGAGTGAAIAASISGFARWKINKILQAYTQYTFQDLPIDPAIMVFAAYKKNTQRMQQIAPQVQSFLNEPGVLEALAHLYFGQEPTSELMMQLQQMLGIK